MVSGFVLMPLTMFAFVSISLCLILHAIFSYVRNLVYDETANVYLTIYKQAHALQDLIEIDTKKIWELESLIKGVKDGNDDNGSIGGD